MRRIPVAAGICVAVISVAGTIVGQQPAFDVLFENGRVIDGTGNPYLVADVGIKDGRIAAIGQLDSASASRAIDATGLYVVPGFVDPHSHSGPSNHEPEMRGEHNIVAQGITTVTLNPDGGAMWPVADHVAQYQRDGDGVNVAMMVGHGKIRQLAMGNEQRPATAAELEKMKQLLAQGLDEGAFGMTTGLEGAPGRWSDTHELVELAKVLAQYGAFYTAHQRSEGRSPRWWNLSRPGIPMDTIDAVRETIEIGERSGARVVGSHVKAVGTDMAGAIDAILRLVDEARTRGVQVYLDTYTYESAGATANLALVPPWALVDDGVDIGGQDGALAAGLQKPYGRSRENLTRRLRDPAQRIKIRRDIEHELTKAGGAAAVLIVEHPNTTYPGKFLADVAAMHGEDAVDAAIRLQMEGAADKPGGGSYRGMNISEADNEALIRKSYVAFCTDAGVVPLGAGFPHPRYYGIYPRALRQYVLDKRVVDLPFAIRAMTSLPASIIGLKDRGVLREGNWADVTVFDPVIIRPKSTFMKPHAYPTGITYVMVNGELVVDGGALTGKTPGKALIPAWTKGQGAPTRRAVGARGR
jgi:N-acyl-D-amino-acid deacylase